MIRGSIHRQLTRNDAEFALRLLARMAPDEEEFLRDAVRDRGIEALLADPRLAVALRTQAAGAHASLPLVVYVLVRAALREVRADDRLAADFLASLVLHFGLRDRARRIREHDEVTYDTLAALLADAECGDPARAFLVRAHLGHYALWLAGLFPDRVEACRHRRGGPGLDYYDELGKHGFELAAQHRLAHEHGVDQLYLYAAAHFLQWRVALNHLSDQVLFPHVHTPDRLLRQVRSAMGLPMS